MTSFRILPTSESSSSEKTINEMKNNILIKFAECWKEKTFEILQKKDWITDGIMGVKNATQITYAIKLSFSNSHSCDYIDYIIIKVVI